MPVYKPTLDFHHLITADLPIEDGQDLLDAQHGFIGTTEHAEVLHPKGHAVRGTECRVEPRPLCHVVRHFSPDASMMWQ